LAYPNKQQFLTLGPGDISPPFQPNGVCSKEMAAEINARTLSSGFECFEWTHKRSDGELICVQVMLTVMVLNNETIIHGVWRNIRAQQQLLSNNLKLSLEISELKSALLNQQSTLLNQQSTLLKQQNKDLTTINQRYKKSFELAPIGIIHLSLNGHFLEVNEGFCQFIGYSHEQLFALTITQLESPSCLPVF
jgi:PAS domain-containing protein